MESGEVPAWDVVGLYCKDVLYGLYGLCGWGVGVDVWLVFGLGLCFFLVSVVFEVVLWWSLLRLRV
jgi:hypothetical protein